MTNSKQQPEFIHKLLKGGAWALLVRAFTVVSNLLLSMLIARLLAPDQVGVYFLLVSVVSVVTAFSLFGLDIAIVRIIATAMSTGKEDVVKSAIVKSRAIGLLSSLSLALVLYFAGLELLSLYVFKTPAIYDFRLLIAIWIILWSLESLNAEIYRGFKQFHLAVLFKRLAPNCVILIISAYFFTNNIEIELHGYLNIVLFGWLFSVLVSSFLLQRHFLKNKKKEDVSVKHLLSMSLPLWFTGWVSFALPQLDLWILAAFQPPEMVAVYGAASRLIRVVGVPLLIIQSIVPPLIAEAHATDSMGGLSKGLQTAAALSFIPGAILCLLYLFMGETILVFVFGSYYAEALLVLQILTIGFLVKLLVGSSESLLTMTGHGRTSMMISICSGLLMLFGCIYVGESYGMVGIAVVAATALSVHNVLNLLFARIQTGIWALPMLRVSQIKRVLGYK